MTTPHKLTFLVSGKGTTLHAIMKAIQANALNAEVHHVISNKKNVPALDPEVIKAQGITLSIPMASLVIWEKKTINREEYDRHLAKIVIKNNPDLIILAGFMHILGPSFFETLNNETNYQPPLIINLHPALPRQFPGANGIRDAYQAFQRGEISYTGSMVHEVVPEVDAGPVIGTTKIPIYSNDSLEDLEKRMKYHEKGLLLNCIQQCLINNKLSNTTPYLLCRGKVRDIWNIGYNLLALVATDRTSSFDRAICQIPQKGAYLTQTSAWWFKKTKHIIDNHIVYHEGNMMIVKKCQVIPIEVVVRGYITGSTQTSLWTHYQRGKRNYCGIEFPNNLRKNQKLPTPVVTPTTKSKKHDQPISAKEIVKSGIVSQNEWNYIEKKALKLFEYASQRALKAGYILADTKLEFGIDTHQKTNTNSLLSPKNNLRKIILIDEAFTPDSSRYWRSSSYQKLFESYQEPECLDKDLIRYFVKSKIENPYDPHLLIPDIPLELVQKVRNSYHEFFWTLNHQKQVDPIFTIKDIPSTINNYFYNTYGPACLILVENDSKLLSTKLPKLRHLLEFSNIYCIVEIIQNNPLNVPKFNVLLEDIQESIDYNPQRKLTTVVISSPQNPSTSLLENTASNLSCPIINCIVSDDHISDTHLNLNVAHIKSVEQCAKFVGKLLI